MDNVKRKAFYNMVDRLQHAFLIPKEKSYEVLKSIITNFMIEYFNMIDCVQGG